MFPIHKFSAQSTHICIAGLQYVSESTKFNFFVVFFYHKRVPETKHNLKSELNLNISISCNQMRL